MCELTGDVSWLGVLVGFVVSYMLGWLWYSPKLFGKKWAEGAGISMEDCDKMPMLAMVVQALATFGLAWLIGITATSNSLATAILILITITLFIVANGKYAQKSNTAVAIEGAYILVMGVIMVIFQGVF